MFQIDEIPDAILAEIAEHIPGADYSNYGVIDDNTVSRKLAYRVVEPVTETVRVLDTETFEPAEVDGTTHQYYTMYMVRLNLEESSIRQVMSTGRIIGRKGA